MVAAISIIIMMEQQARLRLTERRHVNAYTFHHAQQGLGLVAELFMNRLKRTNVQPGAGGGADQIERPDNIEPADAATRFAVFLPDGSTVRFEMTDAQGTILDDPTGSGGLVMTRAAAELRGRDPGGPGGGRFLRKRGPLQVSINSAPPEVIEQLISYGAPGSQASRVASKIVDSRTEHRFDSASLRMKLQEAGVDEKYLEVFVGYEDTSVRPTRKYSGVFTAEPTLRRLLVEFADDRGTVRERYEAIVLQDAGSGTRANVAFLDWRELGADVVAGR